MRSMLIAELYLYPMNVHTTRVDCTAPDIHVWAERIPTELQPIATWIRVL